MEDAKQLIRASGSAGEYYIEANESLGKKDFLMRIRICRKEAKESRFFLRLLATHDNDALNSERDWLINEARELTSIFGSILRKCE